jgi:protein phosphatase
MGGSAHGERASALAVDRFVEELLCDLPHLAGGLLQPSELAEVARDWLRALNEAVLDLGGRLGAPNDVGTTLSGLVFIGSRALLVHVGDSRVYLLRDGTLCQLTRDQTQAEALRETDQNLGEDDLQERYGNVLTSHLGTSGCSPLTELLDVKSGDRFLLCTDGLVAGIDDEDLTEALLELPLERAATSLIRRSKRNLMRQCSSGKAGHSSDNITAVVVDVAIRVK